MFVTNKTGGLEIYVYDGTTSNHILLSSSITGRAKIAFGIKPNGDYLASLNGANVVANTSGLTDLSIFTQGHSWWRWCSGGIGKQFSQRYNSY